MLKERWAVGANDRGHGHYSYAIITEETKLLITEVCSDAPSETSSLELAEHIVKLHNEGLT